MANISYCRFHNTALVPCSNHECAMQDALEEGGMNLEQFTEDLSSDERRAFFTLIRLCDRIKETAEELENNEAYEEVDEEA